MSYHKCPKCEGNDTVCAECGHPRTHRRWSRNSTTTYGHDSHLRARIIKCPEHQQPWFNCDCCKKEHVNGALYLWSHQVFPRKLESKSSEGVGYCGDCASFIRARLEVAFDEAIAQVSR